MVWFLPILKFSKKSTFSFLSSQIVKSFLCSDDNYGKAIFKFSKTVPFWLFVNPNFLQKMSFFYFLCMSKNHHLFFVHKAYSINTFFGKKITCFAYRHKNFCAPCFFYVLHDLEKQNLTTKKVPVRTSNKKFCAPKKNVILNANQS